LSTVLFGALLLALRKYQPQTEARRNPITADKADKTDKADTIAEITAKITADTNSAQFGLQQ
jgi:hypothetical protein